MTDDEAAEIVGKAIGEIGRRIASKEELEARLAEARTCLDKYVKSEANAEMLTVLIRTIETLIDGQPTTPMRKHHHE